MRRDRSERDAIRRAIADAEVYTNRLEERVCAVITAWRDGDLASFTAKLDDLETFVVYQGRDHSEHQRNDCP